MGETERINVLRACWFHLGQSSGKSRNKGHEQTIFIMLMLKIYNPNKTHWHIQNTYMYLFNLYCN